MAAFKDITGQRFGRLVVTKFAGRKNNATMWECICDCGNVRTIDGRNLKSGRTRGCWKHYPKRPRKIPAKGKHPLYQLWCNMRRRCDNPSDESYPNYGGRGIGVCDRWRKFSNFLADMGPRPSPLHSIDRYPDKDGDYAPGNVRWATPTEQANNTRRNIILTAFGRSMTIAQWARETGLGQDTIEQRIRTLRWSHEKAITTPKREWGPGRPKLAL
jgi:hypothetical protein